MEMKMILDILSKVNIYVLYLHHSFGMSLEYTDRMNCFTYRNGKDDGGHSINIYMYYSRKSHNRNVESMEHVATSLCVGWQATCVNSRSCPAKVCRRAPVSTLYKLALLSQLDETHSSSFNHWQPLTTPWCPVKAMMGALIVLTIAAADLDSRRFPPPMPAASDSESEGSEPSSLEPPPMAWDNLSGTTAAFQM